MKNVLALLADWANGLFAVLLVSYWFGVEPQWWYFLVGILLAMSPDIDAIPELLTRGKVAASAEHKRDHRTFLHYPIISLPLGFLAAYLFGFWGMVWLLALILHLINDLYGTGWGLQLLFPLSNRHFKFFARRANQMPRLLQARNDYNILGNEETRLRLVASWSHEELPAYIVRFGIDDWIRVCYLTLNPAAVIEYALFLLAIVPTSYSLLY